MKTIKFSHPYTKLTGATQEPVSRAKLLCVDVIRLEDQCPAFLDYDTDNGLFQLPEKGEYIKLTFLKERVEGDTSRDLFTTLRSNKPGKLEYYRGLLGEVLKVLVTRP